MKKVENFAIVLNVNVENRKIIILDKDLGKLHLSFQDKKKNLTINNNLCNGALINYLSNNENEKVRITDINIIDVPFFIAKKDILFFHHIIELCHFFIPWELPSNELFELLFFAFFSFEKINSLKKQKVFLTKFFLHLGLYPENESIKSAFHYIMTIPIDSIMDMEIDLGGEKELSLWIIKCINMHPYMKSFKTTDFLNKLL